jgi:hypothetical protein
VKAHLTEVKAEVKMKLPVPKINEAVSKGLANRLQTKADALS